MHLIIIIGQEVIVIAHIDYIFVMEESKKKLKKCAQYTPWSYGGPKRPVEPQTEKSKKPKTDTW